MLDLNQSINFVLPYNDDKDYQSLITLLYNERLNFVEKMRNIMQENDILYAMDGNLNYYIHTHLDIDYYRKQFIYSENSFQTRIMNLCDRNAKHKKTLELPSFNSFYYFLENEYNFYVYGEKMENRKELYFIYNSRTLTNPRFHTIKVYSKDKNTFTFKNPVHGWLSSVTFNENKRYLDMSTSIGDNSLESISIYTFDKEYAEEVFELECVGLGSSVFNN